MDDTIQCPTTPSFSMGVPSTYFYYINIDKNFNSYL